MDLFSLGLRLESIGFDDATRQLKQVDEVGKGTANRLGVLGALQKEAAEHAGAHTLSLSRLERAFETFAARATGTNETVALLGATMGRFALGTIETAGILAGIAGVVAVYEHLTEGARAAQKATDDLITSLVKQKQAAFDATIEGMNLIALRAEMEQEAERNKNPMGWRSILGSAIAGHTVLDPTDAENAGTRLQRVASAVTQAYDNIAKAVAEAMKKSGEESRSAAEKAAAAARAAEAAFVKRIEILTKGLIFENTRKAVTAQLRDIEAELTRVMNDGTASLERRTQAAERLATVQAALSEKLLAAARTTANTNPMDLISVTRTGHDNDLRGGVAGMEAGVKLPNAANPVLDRMNVQLHEVYERLSKMAGELRMNIADTFGHAITEGFVAAFSGKGIVGSLKALGKSILAGLGSIFMGMGEKLIAFGLIMSGLLPAFSNPITSAPAAFAAGAALIALGAGMSAIAMGGGAGGGAGGGGVYGGYSAPRLDDITKIRLMPGYGTTEGPKLVPVTPYVFAPTIIGQNDPVAQRQLAEMAEKGARRGLS